MLSKIIPNQLRDLPNSDALESGGPFGLLIFFTIFTFLNMSSRFPVLGLVRPTVLMIGAFIFIIFAQSEALKARLQVPGTKWLGYLLLYIFVTLPFVTYPGSIIHRNFENFAKWAVFFLLTMAFVDSERRLRIFVGTFITCTVIRCIEPLILHILTGYWGSVAHLGDTGESMNRLSGAPSDGVNPNGLAFMCVTAYVFVHHWAMCRGSHWIRKAIYGGVAPGLVYALILTGSRSGVLAFGVAALGMIWFSKRRALGLLVLLIGGAIVITHLSSDMADRYASIYDSATKNASTANGRLTGMKANVELIVRRPIFGYGLGTSLEASFNLQGGTHYAHNLYLEVLIELGLGGFIIFMRYLIIVCQMTLQMTRQVGNSQQILPDGHTLLWLPKALMLWTAMCLFFDIFSFGLSNYEWYLIGGLAMVCSRLLKARNAEEQVGALNAAAKAEPAALIKRDFSSRVLRTAQVS